MEMVTVLKKGRLDMLEIFSEVCSGKHRRHQESVQDSVKIIGCPTSQEEY